MATGSEFSFSIIERNDALGFIIKGSTDKTSLVLTIVNNYQDTFKPIIIDGENLMAFLSDSGFTINAVDVGVEKFKDGIYTFELSVNDGTTTISLTEGFAAIVTEDVIKDALSYRIYQPIAIKQRIQEKMMLLNFLYYASSIGDSDSFQSIIEMLQRMK